MVRSPQNHHGAAMAAGQAILSYSGNRAQVEEFLNREQLDEQVERELANWDRDHSPRNAFWQGIASDAQHERETFQASFTNLLQELGPRDGFAPGARPPKFAQFWNEHKHRVARTFVDGVGEELKQPGLWELCGERGIDGLLDLKCLNLVAEIFVTNDARLYRRLSAVPIKKFRSSFWMGFSSGCETAQNPNEGQEQSLSAVDWLS